jgi:hypothetical protein
MMGRREMEGDLEEFVQSGALASLREKEAELQTGREM